jgi:hypothetical protein
MSTRYLILALALTCAVPNAQGSSTGAKATSQKTATTANTTAVKRATVRKTTKRHVASGRGAYFVPPPPAYMPSVLPELYARNPVINDEEEEEVVAAVAVKPKNPYVKYFYSHDQQAPKPVQSRNGVSTWVVTR